MSPKGQIHTAKVTLQPNDAVFQIETGLIETFVNIGLLILGAASMDGARGYDARILHDGVRGEFNTESVEHFHLQEEYEKE